MTEPVSLRELLGRIELVEPGQVLVIDRDTGAVLARDAAPDDLALAGARFERLDNPLEGKELDWARHFAAAIENADARQRLTTALASQDPFAAFEASVYRCGIAHQWYRFRDEAIVRCVKERLESRSVPYVDDLDAEAS